MSTIIVPTAGGRSPTTIEKVDQIILNVDNKDLSRHELARIVGVKSYEIKCEEERDVRVVGKVVVLLIVSFFSYILGAVFGS
jgi:hypothetical protein